MKSIRIRPWTLAVAIAVVASAATAGPAGATTPAPAQNSDTSVNYYVQQPVATGAGRVTPESATVSGVIDTGGSPQSLLPIGAGGLSWPGSGTIASGENWLDAPAGGSYVPLDGIPVSGSNTNVALNILDNTPGTGLGATTNYLAVSNAGADNFSDVTFEYDPVSDYVANGDSPGGETQLVTDVHVPTTVGLSHVSVNIGAFGPAAVKATGNTPLQPNTQYYYWIVQQAGGTDAATYVNLAAYDQAYLQYALNTWKYNARNSPEPPTVNPYLACIPNVAIAADPTLAAYTTSTELSPNFTMPNNPALGGPAPEPGPSPALNGQCTFYYGSVASGAPVVETASGTAVDSVLATSQIGAPTGEFKTAKLGSLFIAAHAKTVTKASKGQPAGTVTLYVANRSVHGDSGTIMLQDALGTVLARGQFALGVAKHAAVTLRLTKAGKRALHSGETAQLTYTSAWGQQSSRQNVKL